MIVVKPSITGTQLDKTQIIRNAINHSRGEQSVGTMTKTSHRPTRERTVSMWAWTLGAKQSLACVTASGRDAGNGELTLYNHWRGRFSVRSSAGIALKTN